MATVTFSAADDVLYAYLAGGFLSDKKIYQ